MYKKILAETIFGNLSLEKNLFCNMCYKILPISKLIFFTDKNNFTNWVCSEECLNVWILKYV